MLAVHDFFIEHVICVDWVECLGLLVKISGLDIASIKPGIDNVFMPIWCSMK